jgi:4-amino-4-deoxy-L-arabinose transferase-like glycosyltransferase
MDSKKTYSYFLHKFTSSEGKIFFFLILSSILLRFLSFFYSIIDHDESTYLIISNELNNGAQLYKDVIDTKPPGIFIVFSFIQMLLGKSVFAIRLLGAIVIGGSSYLLYRTNKLLGLEKGYSILSGFLFLTVFSLYRFGLVINTELFFTFFTILGLYMMLIAYKKIKNHYWVFGGVAIGIASIFKYVVLADFGAFAIFFFFISILEKKNTTKTIGQLILSGISVLIPFALLNLYFYQIGNYEHFYHITFEVVRNYSSTLNWADSIKFFLAFHLKFLPLLILFYWSLFSKKTPQNLKLLGISWYIMAWVVVILPGKQFDHYYLQLIPVVCLLIPYVLHHLINWKQVCIKKQSNIIAFCALLVIGIAIGNQSYFWTSRDIAKEIAIDLKPLIDKDDIIFTDAKIHLSYYLLGLRPPSKYVHPTLIFNHTDAYGITTEVEMNKIMDQEPEFIIHRNGNTDFELNRRILKDYALYNTYSKFKVLKRVKY